MSDTTNDPTQLFSPEACAALARLLVVIADNKYFLGLRYAEWCNSAPTLEAAIAAAAITQDELGHARSLYPLLRDFPDVPAEFNEDEAARDTFLNMRSLEPEFETWGEFVAANSIPDMMLNVLIEAAADSAYEPLAQRAAKMMQEERFHKLYAEGWTAQFKKSDDALKTLQAGVDRLWAESMAFFGPDGDSDANLLHAEGILNADAATLRKRFVERSQKLLGGVGVKLETNGSTVDWEQWDGYARRMKD